MADAILAEKRFHDDEAAREHLEAIRWPNGPICPHCGGIERNSKLEGKSHRAGLYFCGDCRQQFTVTVGTVFERSKIPLHKWVLTTHLLCASKKGMSSKQIERMLGVTYKTAWFMTHRIREAMKIKHQRKLGGGGKVVEADETFWGSIPAEHKGKKGGWHHKQKIFALVERDGDVRSFHVPKVTAETLKPIMQANIATDTRVHTDEAGQYRKLKKDEFLSHETVVHMSGEYARGDVHVNTAEGYFSLLKRGLVGTFHHVSEQHLSRYMSEFDFRWNHRKSSDGARAEAALRGVTGKRLFYRDSSSLDVAT